MPSACLNLDLLQLPAIWIAAPLLDQHALPSSYFSLTMLQRFKDEADTPAAAKGASALGGEAFLLTKSCHKSRR